MALRPEIHVAVSWDVQTDTKLQRESTNRNHERTYSPRSLHGFSLPLCFQVEDAGSFEKAAPFLMNLSVYLPQKLEKLGEGTHGLLEIARLAADSPTR